jgi:four helix bundle protein
MNTTVSPTASSAIRSFTDLVAWQKGHVVVIKIYAVTNSFPSTETFGLVSQLRRAAVSVTSNIAEGFRRQSWKEKAQFFSMSLGSLTEIENQLLISKDVGFLGRDTYQDVLSSVEDASKVVRGLFTSTKART